MSRSNAAGSRPVQVRGVGEHLGHHRAPRLGVARELDLDYDGPTVGLDGDKVGSAAAEDNLAPDDGQPGISGERQDLRGLLHQRVQRRLVRESGWREQLPAGAIVPPNRRHRT